MLIFLLISAQTIKSYEKAVPWEVYECVHDDVRKFERQKELMECGSISRRMYSTFRHIHTSTILAAARHRARKQFVLHRSGIYCK